MTAEIVNLRKVRKVRARAQEQVQAAENRARFGRSKGERALSKMEAEAADRRLAAHRLEGIDGADGKDSRD